MKCIKRGNEIRRVNDKEAYRLVNNGWTYCSKSLWKGVKGVSSTESNVVEGVDVGVVRKKKDNSRGKDYKRKKAEKAEKA